MRAQFWNFLKDIFWMQAFVLIVLFWVELQTQVARMTGVEKLKPYLIGKAIAAARSRVARGGQWGWQSAALNLSHRSALATTTCTRARPSRLHLARFVTVQSLC